MTEMPQPDSSMGGPLANASSSSYPAAPSDPSLSSYPAPYPPSSIPFLPPSPTHGHHAAVPNDTTNIGASSPLVHPSAPPMSMDSQNASG